MAQKSRLEAQSKLIATKHLLVLQGWVGEDEVNLLTQQLAAKLGADTVYIDFEESNNGRNRSRSTNKIEKPSVDSSV